MTTIINIYPNNMNNYKSGIFAIPQRNIDQVKVGTILRNYHPVHESVYFDTVVTIEMMKGSRLTKSKFKFENVLMLAEPAQQNRLSGWRLDAPIVWQEKTKTVEQPVAKAVLQQFGITHNVQAPVEALPVIEPDENGMLTADQAVDYLQLRCDILKDEKRQTLRARLYDLGKAEAIIKVEDKFRKDQIDLIIEGKLNYTFNVLWFTTRYQRTTKNPVES